MDKKRFYVYEWFNVDTGEVFYVGKGTASRWRSKKNRNQYFKNYVSKYNCDVRKVKQNLTEEESFNLEIETILKYKEKGECKCNLTSGGEGATFEEYSEEWYRQKFRLFDISRRDWYTPQWCLGLEKSFERAGGYKPCDELSFEDMKIIWNEYLDNKVSDYTFEDMLLSDPSFKDLWEGLC